MRLQILIFARACHHPIQSFFSHHSLTGNAVGTEVAAEPGAQSFQGAAHRELFDTISLTFQALP